MLEGTFREYIVVPQSKGEGICRRSQGRNRRGMLLVQSCLLSFPSIIAYVEALEGRQGFGIGCPGGSTQGYAHRHSGLNRLGKRAESEE